MRRGYNQTPDKQWMEVIHVYPARKEIAGTLRDGGTITVSVFEVPTSFRWPMEGEIWTIEKDALDNTHWILGSRVHHQPLEAELQVSEMAPGELRLDATTITDAHGVRLLTTADGVGDKNYVHTQAIPNDVWVVTHNLNKFPSVTVVDSADTEVEGAVHHTDKNALTITFSSAFGGKAYVN